MRISPNYKQTSTHVLTLIKAIGATKGDVCEVGTGLSSTPLLHWITLGRKLMSYENDPAYLHFAKNFQSNNHRIRHLDEIDFNRHWSVVFIDHSPKKPKTRGDDAIKFTNADLIVLHDTEPGELEHYGYQQVFDKYKYHYHWTKCKPYTSVVSNVIDVTKWQN